jgi:D-sedoheptulose 7-phosphate isomerase
MSLINKISKSTKDYILKSTTSFNLIENNVDQIIKASLICIDSLKSGGTIFFCGNGGSASDANHLAAELVGKFYKDRRPLRSISLSANNSTITAIANDYGFENVFSRQIDALGTNADTLIAISTSGNSKNIIKCIKAANHLGMESILLTGKSESEASENSKLSIHADSSFPGIIQQSHITIGQLICWNIDQFID